MKNILIMTNDVHLGECLSIMCWVKRHDTRVVTSGAVGYALMEQWKPELVICGELDDCHAGSVPHTVVMGGKLRPYMVALHRPFEHPLQDEQYDIRCLEMGFDEVHRVPFNIEMALGWLKKAGLREVESWPGNSLLSSPQSSSGSSSGSYGS